MPERLRRRPQFGGMPVPFTTLVRDGKPDFRVNDVHEWLRAASGRLCNLCGEPLTYHIWFIGGEKCLRYFPEKMHPKGLFADLGMHEECARYATESCPFLSGKHPEYSERGVSPEQVSVLILDAAMERPHKLGLFRTREYKILPGPRLLVATGPIFDIEWFWQRPGTGGAK
jgi:hypothetical protein